MILCDVNVLIFAHKEGADRHDEYRAWLEDAMNGDEAFGVSDLVLSSVLRIVTHPRVFDPPSTWDRAREFADSVRSAPSAVPVAPEPHHSSEPKPRSGCRLLLSGPEYQQSASRTRKRVASCPLWTSRSATWRCRDSSTRSLTMRRAAAT